MGHNEFGCFLFLLVTGLGIWLLIETLGRRSRQDMLARMLRHTQDNLEKTEADVESLKAAVAKLSASDLEPRRGPFAPAAPKTVPRAVLIAPEPPTTVLPAPPISAVQDPLRTQRVAPHEADTGPIPTLAPEPTLALPEAEERPALAPLPEPALTLKSIPERPSLALPPPVPPAPGLPIIDLPEQEPAKPFDWESLIGVKLFSWVAGIALFVAAILFVLYGIDHGWITPAVQMSMVVALGLGALVASETERVQQYGVTAHALAAAGIAILFAAFFAGSAGWKLMPGYASFFFMALTAAVAVLLSIRRDSIFIALLGLLGGFATPVLLSTGEDHPIGLFGYLLLLNVGLNAVAYRKRWPILKALSLTFTTLYQFGWLTQFLTEGKLGIAIGIFLVFPVITFSSLLLGKRQDEDTSAFFERMSSFASIPPLLFALHFAAVPGYGAHYGMLFGFQLLVVAGLAALALWHGPEWLHLLGAGSTLLVWVLWFENCYRHEAWPWVMGFLALFIGIFLGLPWLQSRLKGKRPFTEGGQLGVYAAPLLLCAFPVLVALEPATAKPGLIFGVLLLFMTAMAAFAIRFQEGFVHFTACFFVLLTEAIWSGKYLSPARLIPALMIYGTFGLFYLGVPILAEAKQRTLRPQGSGAILALASLAMLFFLTIGPIATSSLWALAILVGILNVGLLYEAASGHRPLLSLLGMVLSWILLAVWWISAPIVGMLVPALAVVGGFALLVVGGSFWLKSRNPEGASGVVDPALFLGLVGHLFLFAVVVQPRLSMPPWPWLAVLLVLNLAIGVATLHLRKGLAFIPALLLTQILLCTWQSARLPDGYQQLALWTAVGFGGMGLLWTELARRREAEGFEWAAGLGLILAQVSLMVFASNSSQHHASLVLAHLLLACGLLTLAARSGRQGWAVALAFSAGLALWQWEQHNLYQPHFSALAYRWGNLLWLATALYLTQLLYPLLLGLRAQQERLPFLSAVLASVVYLWFARLGLNAAGYGGMIGALPVVQAILLLPHLLRLLSLEEEGQRDLGRLALVAGAILGFITVAIPLQLDKEWITIGWALLGAALAWLYTRVPHKGLLLWCGGLLTVVLARLTFNQAIWEYHTRSSVPIFNWFLYTYLIAAACYFVAARFLADTDDTFDGMPFRLSTVLPIGGAVMLFWLLNIEIADVFSEGPALTFHFTGGLVAQQLAYTIGWALYTIGLLTVGIVRHSKATRVASIIMLTLTIGKAFFLDLDNLSGLYRVASFLGLAVCLMVVAVLLQKFVLKKGEGA